MNRRKEKRKEEGVPPNPSGGDSAPSSQAGRPDLSSSVAGARPWRCGPYLNFPHVNNLQS